MPSLRLSPEDQTRFGVPDLLPFDVANVTNREAIELAKLGFPTPVMFRRALIVKPEDADMMAWTAAVWLALKRAGVEVDVATLEFNWDVLEYIPDPDPVEPKVTEGKADPSTNSTTSTRGGTSRARSRKASPGS